MRGNFNLQLHYSTLVYNVQEIIQFFWIYFITLFISYRESRERKISPEDHGRGVEAVRPYIPKFAPAIFPSLTTTHLL